MKKMLIIGSILILSCVIGFGIFYANYVKTHDVINGPAMEPTFKSGQNLTLNLLNKNTKIDRGDIVEYKDPKYSKLIHRVIGLPGEKVVIQNNRVQIFSKDYPEGFTPEYSNVDSAASGSVDIQLGDNQFFVLGDNRPNSYDSRIRGPIERQDIFAKVTLSSVQK